MFYIVLFYVLVAGLVWVTRYEQTPDDFKAEVRKHWIKYFVQCLGWPVTLIRRDKGFGND